MLPLTDMLFATVTLPLFATRNFDALPIMKLIAAARRDVVDAVFVGRIVEPLKLAQRAVLVVKQHAGIRAAPALVFCTA